MSSYIKRVKQRFENVKFVVKIHSTLKRSKKNYTKTTNSFCPIGCNKIQDQTPPPPFSPPH